MRVRNKKNARRRRRERSERKKEKEKEEEEEEEEEEDVPSICFQSQHEYLASAFPGNVKGKTVLCPP
jgi:hypothetical protein